MVEEVGRFEEERLEQELFSARDLALFSRITTYVRREWRAWELIELNIDRRRLRRLLRKNKRLRKRYRYVDDWVAVADLLVRGELLRWARRLQCMGYIGRVIFVIAPHPPPDHEIRELIDQQGSSGVVIAQRHRSRRSIHDKRDSDGHLWPHVHALVEQGPNWTRGRLRGSWSFGQCVVSEYEKPNLEDAVRYVLWHTPIQYRSDESEAKRRDPVREHIAAWAEMVRQATGRKKLRVLFATRTNSKAGVPAVPSLVHGGSAPNAGAAGSSPTKAAQAVQASTLDRGSGNSKRVQRVEHHFQIGQDATARERMSSNPSLSEPTLPARYFRLQRIAATPGRRPTAAAVRRLAEQLFNMEVQHMEEHGLPHVRRGKAGWLRQLRAEGIWHPDLDVDLREIEATWMEFRAGAAALEIEWTARDAARERSRDHRALRRFDPRRTSCPKAQEVLRRLDWFSKNGKLIDAEPVRELMELLHKEQAELSAAPLRPGERRPRHSEVTILRSLRALGFWHDDVDEDLRHAQEETARDREPYRRVCRATVQC